MKTVTWRKLMTVSGFLCLPLANAAAANQDWSATPSGTNDNGQYLANSGTNWSSGNAPVGNGDLWRFTGASTGVNIYNNFAADTKFALSFESGPPAYTISGNRINLSAITNNSDQTETLNLDVLMNGNLEVNGNNPAGTIAITGTLVGTANVQLKPMLSGTLSIGSIDFGSYRLQLGTTAQKGGDWTTLSNALSSVVIGNLSGAFDNFSFGKVMLTGSNHLTGQTALGNQSLTEFRYTGTADRKLTNNDLTIYNGTLLLTGGTVTEQVNRLRVSANYAYGVGDTRIVRDSGSSSIMVNSIDRNNNNYYTLNISDDNLLGAVTNVFGSAYHSGTFTGPLIAPTWLTVNASDWAVYDTETKYLRALKTAEYTAFAADLNNGDAHALLNGSAAVNNNLKANTLKLTTTTASGTLTLGAGAKLTLNSGGLLLTGAHDYTISGGIITSSYENQLLLALNLWNDSAGALDLATDLNVSYLIKSGSGALILSGSNSFPAYGTTREFTISSGTVILNHEYALNNAGLALNIGTGGLDLNDYHAVVRSVRGQSNGQFTITNSGKNIVDLVVGQRDDSDPNEGSHTFGLATAVITGNLRLVLQGNSNTSLTFVNDNTHTGGLKLIGSSTARGDYFHYRFTKAGSFGAAGAPLELGDNGGFAVWASNWDDWTTPVMISGSNTFITSQSGNRLASNGAWSGNGDVELRNLTLTLASPLDAFSGTIKFSAAGANTTNKVTTVTSPIVSGSALTTGSAATYALWRAADGGNDESTLNVTLQFKGAGAAYDVHIGDLVSFSQLTGSAAMKSGDNENSRGLVANNTENSTANLIVGSANHAYSEFAERIADSGTLDVNGAVTGVQSNAKVAVTKVGTGTWALTGSNTYSGSTTVSGGVLLISGEGNLANTSAVTVSGGTLQLTDNGTIANPNNTAVEVTNGALLVDTAYEWTRNISLNADGVLGGSGTIGTGELYFEDASAGVTGGGVGTTGTLTFGVAQSFWGDFTYYFDILSETVHDQLNFSGGLTFAENDQITLNVTNLGELTEFSNVLIISGQLDNYDKATWQLDEGFSLNYNNNALFLSYSIPEPSTWLLLGAGATLLVFLRRRR